MMHRYTVYGVRFASELCFNAPLPQTAEPADLVVSGGPEIPPGDWDDAELRYQSASLDELANPVVSLFQSAAGYRLHFPRGAEFFLTGGRIHIRPLRDADPDLIEIFLLGTVLSWWRECQGIAMLHGAAIGHGGGAAVFLASNRGGKSSLAASLIQAGSELLTDDLLAVEAVGSHWLGYPGYPRMRMWPDQAQHFVGSSEGLASVTSKIAKLHVPVSRLGGAFRSEPLPLRALYLPERRPETEGDPEVRIASASPSRGLIALVRNSFLARMVEAAGLQPDRLTRFARLAGQVPLRTLSYPSGVEHLPRVAAAVQEDLLRLGEPEAGE